MTHQQHKALFEALRDNAPAPESNSEPSDAICPCGNEAESGSEYCYDCNEQAAHEARYDREARAY